MIFRLSHKLTATIEAGPLRVLPAHANPLLDWSAHLFVADRRQFIILCNTKTLCSTVMPGKGIDSIGAFIEAASGGIRQLLKVAGRESTYDRLIAPAVDSVHFAKALDRSVTGSMNDLIAQATVWLARGDATTREVGIRLNDILLSALAANESDYGKPREALEVLLRTIV